MGDFAQGSRDLTKLYNEAVKLSPSGKVRLIHIDAQDVEPGDGAIGAGHHFFHYHFVPHTPEEIAAANGDESKLGPKPIMFGGKRYDFWPSGIANMEITTGQAAEPTLQVMDINGEITRLCLNHSNLLGAKVEIIETFACFLDGQPDADPSQYQIETWYIDNVPTRSPGTVVAFGLSSPADLEGQVVPRRQIMNICTWAIEGKYGSGDGCTWDRSKPGIIYYDENGAIVANVVNDKCGGCLSDCQKRFGQGYADPKAAPLDYGGFPGSYLQGL